MTWRLPRLCGFGFVATVAACTTNTGGSGAGAAFVGGSVSSACNHAVQDQGCHYDSATKGYQRVTCGADGTWALTAACASGQLCKEVAQAGSSKKTSECYDFAVQQGAPDANSGGTVDATSSGTVDACLKAKCGVAYGACQADAKCAQAFACLSGCKSGDNTCVALCLQVATGSSAVPGLLTCSSSQKCDGGASGPVCGNGQCETGETAGSCAADCKPATGPACGNGTCEQGETAASCPADCKPVAPDGPCGCLLPDQWFHFDMLKLTSLDGGQHPVIKTLNGLWAVDIDHNELNLYFHVVAVTPTAVKVEVVNGARIEDPQPLCKCSIGGDKCDATARTTDTCLLDANASLNTTVAIEFPRDGCHLKPSAKAGINVYAGTTTGTKNCAPTLPVKHAIPVRSAVLQAEMGPECKTIEDGLVLDGSFSEFALGKICTCVATSAQFTCPTCGVVDPTFVPDPKNGDDVACGGCNSKYQSLKSLLELFGDLNYTCKAEDGGKAVCLTAAFHGVRIEAPPPSCGKLK